MPNSPDVQWVKVWCESTRRVLYCCTDAFPRVFATSILGICICNTLNAAPNPGIGPWKRAWKLPVLDDEDTLPSQTAAFDELLEKHWDTAEFDGLMATYYNEYDEALTGPPVLCIDEMCRLQGHSNVSPKEVQEAVSNVLCVFSADVIQRCVCYKNTTSGKCVEGMDEVKQHNALRDAAEPGVGWVKTWHAATESVYYVNTTSGAHAQTLADVSTENVRLAVKAAPVVTFFCPTVAISSRHFLFHGWFCFPGVFVPTNSVKRMYD